MKYKINYHTHTKRCGHASGSDREYVEAAIEAGFEILGIADHCPWVFPDGFVSGMRLSPSEVEEYFYSFEKLKNEYKNDIEIHIGFEEEYIPELIDGTDVFLKDYPLEYRILGQHFLAPEHKSIYVGDPVKENKYLKKYIDLCIEGMQTNRYIYLAHPDVINFIGDMEYYKKEMERLCLEMKKIDAIMEFNILGYVDKRHYPKKEFLEIASRIKNKICFGVDAHDPKQLLNLAAFEEAEKIVEKYSLQVEFPKI